MSVAKEVMDDSEVMRYGTESTFKIYYTCFPREDNHPGVDCLLGKYDPCWAMKEYDITNWTEYAVPKIIPKSMHEEYLRAITKNKGLRILTRPNY